MAIEVGALYIKLNLDSRAFMTQLEKIKLDLGKIADKPIQIRFSADKIDTSSIKGVRQELTNIGTSTRSLIPSFTNLGSVINTAFSFAVISALSRGITEIGAAIASVIPLAANFESQMSAVKAVLSPTGEEFDALKQKALDLGQSTSFTATEAAFAIEELGKQGVNITSILGGAADAAVNLAAATGTDLVTSATVTTDVMNAFGLSADQLDQAVNGITGAVNLSKFDINDYQLALARGGAAVASFGVSFEDFNAVMAATSTQFNSGMTAGTAFRTFINRLTPSTDKAKEAMRELGLITADGTNVFYDASGSLKSMEEVAEIVQNTFGGLTEAQQAAYIETIFGQEAIGTLIGLMRVGGEGIRQFSEDIGKIDAAEQAKTRLDNFSGATEMLKGSLETLSITIGDAILPALTDFVQGLVEIVNVTTSVAEAILGSSDAFNSLPAPLQTVVVIVQDVIDYFSSLASLASGWGSNIGSSFADGIISAANDVIDALMEMGSWVEYWLAPGSPPRITPELDTWGKDAATVYFNSWKQGDASALRSIGDAVRDALKFLTFTGEMKEENVIPTMLGTKEAFTAAINEIRRTGSISEQSFNRIIESAGDAGETIRGLVTAYLRIEQTTQRVARATGNLRKAQLALARATEDYQNALAPVDAQLEAIRRQQEQISLAQELEELQIIANSFGGDESEREAARLRIQEILLEQQRLAIEEQYAGTIANAEAAVTAAEEELDAAEQAQAEAELQLQIEQERISVGREQNDLIREQIQLMRELAEQATEEQESGGGGGGGGGRAQQTDRAAEAQERYNYQIADTEGKLAILRDRLAGVQEGSEEYYQILGQIHGVEETLANERDRDAKKLEEEQERKAKAERDYNYSIADTAGKLRILRDELANAEAGSEEYYRIATQIAQLERQEEDRQSRSAGGGAGGVGASAAQERMRQREEEARERREQQLQEMYEQQRLAAEERRNQQEQLADSRNTISQIRSELSRAMGGFTSLVSQLLTPITTIWSSIWSSIQFNLQSIMTSIESIITNGTQILQSLWAENGAQISADISETWDQLVTIISTAVGGIFTIVAEFLREAAAVIATRHDDIQNIVMTVWNALIGIIQGALQVVQGIINAVIGAIRGDWQQFFTGLLQIAAGILNAVAALIQGILELIANSFGTTLTEIGNTWASNWKKYKDRLAADTAAILTALGTWWDTIVRGWNQLVTDVTNAWSTFWSETSTKASTITTEIGNTLATWYSNITDAWTSFVDGLKSAWETAVNTLAGTIQTALDNAKNVITNLSDSFKTAASSLGGSIIDGIKNGISNGISGLAEAARSAARSAIEAGWRALNISSPSKVFMEIGKAIPDDMAVGIAKSIPDVAASSNRMALSTIPQPSNKSGTTIINEWNIDARGSTMREEDFRRIIREEQNKAAEKGNKRSRF